MSKRRNLAVAMAGAMVATAVVPAFASVKETTIALSDKEKLNELYDDVEDKLKIEFSEDDENVSLREEKVYLIEATEIDKENNKKVTTITNLSKLQEIVRKLDKGSKLEVKITDRGHQTINKENFSTSDKYLTYTKDIEKELKRDAEGSDLVTVEGKTITIKAQEANSSVSAAAKEITVSEGEARKDFKKSIKTEVIYDFVRTAATYTSDDLKTLKATIGNKLDTYATVTDNESAAGSDDATEVTISFNEVEGITVEDIVLRAGDNTLDLGTVKPSKVDVITDFSDVEDTLVNKDIPSDEKSITTIKSATSDKFNIDKVYNGLMLNLEGNKLLSYVRDMKADDCNEGDYDYKIEADGIKLDEDDREITIDIERKKENDKDVEYKLYKTITIESKDTGDLRELKDILDDGEHRARFAGGNDRYETAVELAKQTSIGTDEIVLVNSTSMVDGLTAGPLAAALDAPVLLTDKNALPKATVDFIKNDSARIKDITVHLVGGEAVISEGVEKELKDLGVRVERLGGEDRQDTSLKVANKINKMDSLQDSGKYDIEKVFVVGPNGEADAMSISPVASGALSTSTNADIRPIIVAGFDEMSKTVLQFIDGLDIDIIGGTNAVSEDIEKELEKIDYDQEITRVDGKDRFETNKNVINEYYDDNSVGNIFVVKDSYNGKNNEELIDALAAGPVAGKAGGFVVLASKEERVEGRMGEAIDNKLIADAKDNGELVQVGAGVHFDVIEKLAKKIGLVK